jgi:hypothetical protein
MPLEENGSQKMSKQLDFEKDNTIDVANLQKEFRNLPPNIYRYSEIKAEADETHSIKKAQYEELKSKLYLEFRSREGKITENTLAAMIESDESVKAAQLEMFAAKRDLDTLKGYLDSLQAKKDMLIQLGADARKE